MLNDLTQWLADLVKRAFGALFDLVNDAAVSIVTAFLHALAALIASIPVPDFLSAGLASLWAGLSPGIVYLASAAGVPQALALIGSGFAFRLLRKVFTLFQWYPWPSFFMRA